MYQIQLVEHSFSFLVTWVRWTLHMLQYSMTHKVSFSVTPQFLQAWRGLIAFQMRVKPVLKTTCCERPSCVLRLLSLIKGGHSCNWTCHERPPAISDHISWLHGWCWKLNLRFYTEKNLKISTKKHLENIWLFSCVRLLSERNILGKQGSGVYVLFSGLDIERLVLSAGPIG